MKGCSFLLFLVVVVGVCCWIPTDAAEIGAHLRKNSKLMKAEEIPAKQHDEEDGDEEKEYWTPHLYPHIIKLFATTLGANDSLVNKTVDQFVENFNQEYNGIKPTGAPVVSPVQVPTAQVAAAAVPVKAPAAAAPPAAPVAAPLAPQKVVAEAAEEKDEDEDNEDNDEEGRSLFSL